MEPDVTQTAAFFKLWTWVDAHRKQLLWGVMLAAAIGLVTGFVVWRRDQPEDAANEALSKSSTEGFLSGQLPKGEVLVKVAATYPETSGGGRALLLAAARYFGETN